MFHSFGSFGQSVLVKTIVFKPIYQKLPTNMHFIWPRGCRGEDFFEIDQSETGIGCGAMFTSRSGQNV
jgi:hypothetical protein